MFASMGIMYAWATPRYLLWEMSLGQILTYHNAGMDLKYPKPDGETETLRNKSPSQIRALKEEMKKLGLIEEQKKSDVVKEAYREKYGDI